MLYRIPLSFHPGDRPLAHDAALLSVRAIEVEAPDAATAARQVAVLLVALGVDTEPDPDLHIEAV